MPEANPPAGTLAPLRLPGRMAPSDALFWYAESALPSFRPLIGGLYVLDRPPDLRGIEAGYDAAVALVPRLRQRVVEAPLHLGLPEWVDDFHFDRAYHLRRVSLPAPGGWRELLDLVAQLLATPLDRERPLWEAYVIEGLEGGRAASFFKTHHSVVDGVGSLAILRGLTQAERDEPVLRVTSPGLPRRTSRGTLERLGALAADNLRQSASLAWQAAGLPWRAAARPGETAAQLWRTARGLSGLATDLATPPVRDPLVGSTSGLSRRLDVMRVPLERLRKIKAPLGVTLNDLVLGVLAGTLGRYHRERRVRLRELNCMVPMNLRGRDERDLLGNRVGMINVVLPLGERTPRGRLERIVRQTRAAKSDQRGAAYPFLVQTLAMLPGPAHRWIARRSLGRVNVACTNVPGIPTRRYMAGAEVQAIHPFASVVQGTPLVMALLSYAGSMDIGVDTDPEAIPDPHRIVELFEEGLDEMERLARGGAGRGAGGAQEDER